MRKGNKTILKAKRWLNTTDFPSRVVSIMFDGQSNKYDIV